MIRITSVKLTNDCSSHQAEGDGHARARSLEAALGSDCPVCKVALKVEDVDQPGGRREAEAQPMKHCGAVDSPSDWAELNRVTW